MVNKPHFLERKRATYKNNDSGVTAVSVIVVITCYIFILSLVLGFFVLSIYGEELSGVELPTQKDIKTYSSEQNFKDCSANRTTFIKQTQGIWEYVCGIGMILKSSHAMAYLFVDNIQKDNAGTYINEYTINNSATNIVGRHGDYVVVLRYTGGGDTNEVQVLDDGFHIPQYFLTTTVWIGDKYFYPYPDADQIEHATIKTVYNDKDLSLDFYFNDEKLFTTTQLNEDKNIVNLFGRFYGGVASYTPEFTLEDFFTNGAIISGLSSNIGDSLNMILPLLTTMLKISTWSIPSWILPPFFVAIFISLPEGILIMALIFVIFRGVS
jgi:hypothetical protein